MNIYVLYRQICGVHVAVWGKGDGGPGRVSWQPAVTYQWVIVPPGAAGAGMRGTCPGMSVALVGNVYTSSLCT
jgi:hypothetical protein